MSERKKSMEMLVLSTCPDCGKKYLPADGHKDCPKKK